MPRWNMLNAITMCFCCFSSPNVLGLTPSRRTPGLRNIGGRAEVLTWGTKSVTLQSLLLNGLNFSVNNVVANA